MQTDVLFLSFTFFFFGLSTRNCSCCHVFHVCSQLLSFVEGFPQPIAIYSLDRKTRARDISAGKNIPGQNYNIRYAPGPYGQPGESTEFFGRRNSYIRFPNKGKLDAKNSITLLAWVLPMRRGPIFEYFRGVRFWVVRRDTLSVHFIRRDRRRTRVLIKQRLRPLRWNYVGATYDQRTGIATLWLDSRPILSQNIGKGITLDTRSTVYMGGSFRGRIACMQVYSVAMTGPQIEKVKNLCNQPGTF